MTCFVVHPVEQDLSQAEQWGQLRFIADRFIYADQIRDDLGIPQENFDKILNAAEEFNPTEDYLVLVGDQLQLVAFAAALHNYHGGFKVLRYDKKAEGYVQVRIET